MTLICGIDEAGRGPVIGPMVMAGILIDKKDLPKLEAMGVTDSKLLSKEKREYMFDKIKKIVKAFEIIITEPAEIDKALESEELNLNWLEAHKSAEIINKLKPDMVTVDSPSNNCKAYSDYLMNLLKNKKVELECMHKADLERVYVGAASILAKVVRDREIEKIQNKYGNCGPGYPSNEITQRFLKENWEKYPEIFRHSWSSYKKYENMKNQKRLEDF
ncbi:MAG: ribonuclease HII [Nanoarchaeota archaeon]